MLCVCVRVCKREKKMREEEKDENILIKREERIKGRKKDKSKSKDCNQWRVMSFQSRGRLMDG